MLQRTSSLSGNQKKVEKIIFPQKCDLDDLKQSGNDMHFCILQFWKFNCKRWKNILVSKIRQITTNFQEQTLWISSFKFLSWHICCFWNRALLLSQHIQKLSPKKPTYLHVNSIFNFLCPVVEKWNYFYQDLKTKWWR